MTTIARPRASPRLPLALTRARLRRCAAFLVILALQFGIFETGLRLWGSSEAAPGFQGLFLRDPDVGYRLQPGARIRFQTREFATDIAINNVGVRDEDDLGPKRPGERRIVILGDSLVLSVQVPQRSTFAEVLERTLNTQESRVHPRVINAGVQGYGPVQELLLFRKLGPVLQPDLVIVFVFVGNDAEEAFASRETLYGSDRSAIERLSESVTTQLRRIVRQSMVLQILRTRAVAVVNRMGVRGGPPEPPLPSYAAHPPERIHKGLAIAQDAIREIARESAKLGARTAVVLMPARFQLVDDDYQRQAYAVTQAGGELVRDAATQRFAKAIDELGLPWLDLLPALRAGGPGADLFFEQNIHLTPRGHEIVGAALQQFLEAQHLLNGSQEANRPR